MNTHFVHEFQDFDYEERLLKLIAEGHNTRSAKRKLAKDKKRKTKRFSR